MNTVFRRSVAAALAFPCGCADAATTAQSADSYPNRPIRLIAPFVPGGPTDIVARLVAQKLSDNLKQTVVVDNRGGAGGAVGMQLAASAAPDGYTLVLGSSGNLAVNPALEPNLPYHPLKDFQPITQKALTSPDVKERFASLGMDTVASTPAEFTAYIKSESQKWEKVIRTIGIKPQ